MVELLTLSRKVNSVNNKNAKQKLSIKLAQSDPLYPYLEALPPFPDSRKIDHQTSQL